MVSRGVYPVELSLPHHEMFPWNVGTPHLECPIEKLHLSVPNTEKNSIRSEGSKL
jgi:hypothetical protein